MPDSNLEPPTLSEVVRLITSLSQKVDTMGTNFVGRQEYSSDQRGIDTKFDNMKTDITDVSKDVAKLAAKVDTQETTARDRNSKYILLIVGAFTTGAIGLLISLVARGAGLQ